MSQDSVVIKEKTVACDGENHKAPDDKGGDKGGDKGDSGHPKIYLNVGADDSVTCPYCGRKFIYKA